MRCSFVMTRNASWTIWPAFSTSLFGAATPRASLPPRKFARVLDERLRARRWDVGGSSGHKRYVVIDAADALKRFMRDGLPDAKRLAEIAAELDQYRRAAAEGATSRLTIFGNMVEMLSAEGNTRAVISFEKMWTALTHDLPFLTLCGYATSCFHDGVPGLWSDACNEHRVLSHATDV